MKMEYLQYFDTGILTGFCSLIFWLSHQSGLPVPGLFPHQDKLAHFAEYAFLGFLAWRCLRHQIKSTELLFLASLGFCSIYGALDEVHQSFIPSRTSDVLDWLADFIGSGISIGLLTLIRLRQERQQTA
ncbi:MAG: VanZ family protein [Methylococcales bacterium]